MPLPRPRKFQMRPGPSRSANRFPCMSKSLPTRARPSSFMMWSSSSNTLASLYRQSGSMQKALDYCNQALQIEQNGGSRQGQAFTEDIEGHIYSDMGEEQKALDLFNRTLVVWRQLGSRTGEASALTLIGKSYSYLAQEDKALDALNQALPLWRQTGKPGWRSHRSRHHGQGLFRYEPGREVSRQSQPGLGHLATNRGPRRRGATRSSMLAEPIPTWARSKNRSIPITRP